MTSEAFETAETSPAPERIAGLGGVILCGGKSSRMGRPKAWLPFGGQTLLARTAKTVKNIANPIVIVAAPGQDVPPLWDGAEIVRDPVEGRGPLQGIAAGLGALKGRCDAAFVSSADAPFLHPAIVRRLAELRLGKGAAGGPAEFDIAVPRALGHYHPLCAIYSCAVLDDAIALLNAGRLRAGLLLERAKTIVADEALLLADPELAAADPELRGLSNINTPDEYEAALREARAI